MGAVTLSQLKLGDKLAEDVLTPLGSVLFHKGHIIQSRELDILQAFLIRQVEVSDPPGKQDAAKPAAKSAADEAGAAVAQPKEAAGAAVTSFEAEYDRLVLLLKKSFQSVSAASALPVLDLRKQLEIVLSLISQYNPLTFVPRSFQESDYWYHNSAASALTSYLIAQWSGIPQKDWMQLALAGLLHDIGNVKLDPSILHKPSKLTAEETEEMMRHTKMGYQLLKNVAALNEGVKLTALQHHEREDGTGYPLNIMAESIHPYAKIVAIADIFHAMTMSKAYRKGQSPYLVLEQIKSDAFGKLDPGFVTVFVDKVTQFVNGTKVRLSDGRVGEIIFSDRVYPTRPWVSVGGTIVNLTVERQLYILEVLK